MQTFEVTGMSCAHCAASIKDAIALADPDAQVSVDVGAGTVVVSGETAPADVLMEAIAAEGYEARPAEG